MLHSVDDQDVITLSLICMRAVVLGGLIDWPVRGLAAEEVGGRFIRVGNCVECRFEISYGCCFIMRFILYCNMVWEMADICRNDLHSEYACTDILVSTVTLAVVRWNSVYNAHELCHDGS